MLHSLAALTNHRRVSLAAKAQQQLAAAQQSRFLAKVAAPIKERLLDQSKQMEELDAVSQQLIQTMPQSQCPHAKQSGRSRASTGQRASALLDATCCSIFCHVAAAHREHNAVQGTFVAKLRHFADELERGIKRRQEVTATALGGCAGRAATRAELHS